jgi:Tol biopolymer transport system component
MFNPQIMTTVFKVSIVFYAWSFFHVMQSPAHQLPGPLKGKYLGLPTPSLTAETFAKGIVSTDEYEHSAPAFSSDGKIMIWGLVSRDKPSYLLEMRQQPDGTWTTPQAPGFQNSAYDHLYPRFSPDGKKLYFTSRRPLPQGFPPLKDAWIWVTKLNDGSWTEPVPLDSSVFEGYELAHSHSKKGSLYFSFRKEGGRIFDIGFSGKKNNKYQPIQIAGDGISTSAYEDGPFISPDEKYLIFESSRPGGFGSNDLYICFKEKNGKWSAPINMGDKINTNKSERFAGLSPDQKYFFFGSDRNGSSDIFWIDAKVISDSKPLAK